MKRFDRVQALLAKNSEKKPSAKKLERVYMLESLVRCAACEGTMTRATAKADRLAWRC